MGRWIVGLALLGACNGGTDTGTETEPDTDTDTDTQTAGTYENDWYHADPSLIPTTPGTGWERGKQIPNLHLVDQNGDEMDLYQFAGRTLILDWVGEWCAPCGTYAPYMDTLAEELGDDATVVALMMQDRDHETADARAVERWIAEHGSRHPVAYIHPDDDWGWEPESWPTIMVVDDTLHVGNKSINDFQQDLYIDEVMDRAKLMTGGRFGNTESCTDVVDNDMDGWTDCLDSECESACSRTSLEGSFPFCDAGGSETDIHDLYTVEITAGMAAITVDTVSTDTRFDVLARARPAGTEVWSSDAIYTFDDEIPCSHPLTNFGCGYGWLRPGTWEIAVTMGGGSNGEDCGSTSAAGYILHVDGADSLTATLDDVDGQPDPQD